MTSTNHHLQLLQSGYQRTKWRRLLVLLAMTASLFSLIVLDLAAGPANLTTADVWRGLLAGPHGNDTILASIIWQLRMPQTIMGVIVGACLGLAGLQMQTILANPLASPFTLGFSAAAGFGASLAILHGSSIPLPGYLVTPVAAVTMTLIACFIVYLIAKVCGASSEILVLAGVATLFLFQSSQSLLQFTASPEALQQIVFWLFGSLLKATWTSVSVAGIILFICIYPVFSNAWDLTTLRLGDANARSLGLSVEKLRRKTFLIVALLTAAAVSFVGTIGFVGLIAPHAARSLVGEDHRYSLPLSAVFGSAIIIAASAIGKFIIPTTVIPVGIITAVAGVPILFLIIIRRTRSRQRT